MPNFRLRKMMLFSETIHHENGPPPAIPRRRGAIVAIVANPFAGTWQADLRSSMDALKPLLKRDGSAGSATLDDPPAANLDDVDMDDF